MKQPNLSIQCANDRCELCFDRACECPHHIQEKEAPVAA